MYHRRKRKRYSDGAGSLDGTLENEGPNSEMRNVVGSMNKMEEKEMSIVISDSDSLELEEDISLQQKSGNHRKTLATKRKIARMTEEEQLALAVKISEQEQATRMKHRQEDDDDELLRKAIEESLHSCNLHDNIVAATSHGLPVDLSPCKEDVILEKQSKEQGSSLQSYISGEDPLTNVSQGVVESTCAMSSAEEDIVLPNNSKGHFSQKSWMSEQSPTQSPKVLLERLSQDIVESTSVILSPNCKEPFSCITSLKTSSLSQSNRGDFLRLSPPKASLSPVFPVRSPYARRMIPCRLFQSKSPSERDEINDHCSESSQLSSASLVSTSKSELPEDGRSYHNRDFCGNERNISTGTKDDRHVFSEAESSDKKGVKQRNDGTIHYYWGIPFCPKGVDPNAYTQVILCQLEAYEKSLKKAQRHLLHKKYCQPVNLKDSLEITEQKDNLGSLSQEDTEEIVEVGDQKMQHRSPLAPTDESDGLATQPVSSKRPKFSDGSLQKSQDDDHSCPLEKVPVKQPAQEPFLNILPDECEGVARVKPVERSMPPENVKDEKRNKERIQIGQDEEVTSCPETPPSSDIQEDSDQKHKLDLTDNTQVSLKISCPNGPSSEENVLEPDCPQDVECPMCGCKFSQGQIERHAAYCDGAKDEPEMAVLRPRNRLSKRINDGPFDGAPSSDSGVRNVICVNL